MGEAREFNWRKTWNSMFDKAIKGTYWDGSHPLCIAAYQAGKQAKKELLKSRTSSFKQYQKAQPK